MDKTGYMILVNILGADLRTLGKKHICKIFLEIETQKKFGDNFQLEHYDMQQ